MPICIQVQFKALGVTYKVPDGLRPGYPWNQLHPIALVHLTWSARGGMLQTPSAKGFKLGVQEDGHLCHLLPSGGISSPPRGEAAPPLLKENVALQPGA